MPMHTYVIILGGIHPPSEAQERFLEKMVNLNLLEGRLPSRGRSIGSAGLFGTLHLRQGPGFAVKRVHEGVTLLLHLFVCFSGRCVLRAGAQSKVSREAVGIDPP